MFSTVTWALVIGHLIGFFAFSPLFVREVRLRLKQKHNNFKGYREFAIWWARKSIYVFSNFWSYFDSASFSFSMYPLKISFCPQTRNSDGHFVWFHTLFYLKCWKFLGFNQWNGSSIRGCGVQTLCVLAHLQNVGGEFTPYDRWKTYNNIKTWRAGVSSSERGSSRR